MRGEILLLGTSRIIRSWLMLALVFSFCSLFAGNPHTAIINEGDVFTHCLDTSALLPDQPSYILNNCPQAGGESVNFDLNENTWCVSYEGTNVGGQDTACVVICTGAFVCDTTFFYITTLPSPPVITDTILINSSETLCNINFPNLAGNVLALDNFCGGSNPENVEFTIDNTNLCVDYYGATEGLGRACIRATSDLGSDFVYFDVVVRLPEPEFLNTEVEVGESVELCASDLEIFGANQKVKSICGDSEFFNSEYNQMDNCFNIEGLEEGTDIVCFTICDELDICDSIEVEVTVLMRNQPTVPVANDDIFDAIANQDNTLTVCANDDVNTTEEPTLSIVPASDGGIDSQWGTSTVSPNACEIIYTPLEIACVQTDSLMYEMCTSNGCNRAVVTINITCEEPSDSSDMIKVYSGFSPNGDDTNDNLEIAGLELFPDHTLTIFNRYGAQLLEVKDYQNDWAGTWNGTDLPGGVYYYLIDTGAGSQQSGWFVLHR